MKENLAGFKFSETYIKNFLKSNDSTPVLIFALASVIVELVAILCFFNKQRLWKIPGLMLSLGGSWIYDMFVTWYGSVVRIINI